MTLMSWMVVFAYALKEGGSILNGILALVGISFAHLATNLFDDYVDYKKLSTSQEFMDSTDNKLKCVYIKSGEATLKELLLVVCIYCGIASLIGLYLLIHCGSGVLWLGLIGAIIVLSYAKMSSVGLSEIAVGTAFGPLLFEGVYYVMTGQFSLSLLILSIAVVIFTTILLYVHTFLDYDGDIVSHKKTLCCRIGEKFGKLWALNFFLILAITSYLSILAFAIIKHNLFYLITYLTIPQVTMLYFSLRKYIENKTYTPQIKWWHYPLDNWNEISQTQTAGFYFNLFCARNVAMYFQLLAFVAVILR